MHEGVGEAARLEGRERRALAREGWQVGIVEADDMPPERPATGHPAGRLERRHDATLEEPDAVVARGQRLVVVGGDACLARMPKPDLVTAQFFAAGRDEPLLDDQPQAAHPQLRLAREAEEVLDVRRGLRERDALGIRQCLRHGNEGAGCARRGVGRREGRSV